MQESDFSKDSVTTDLIEKFKSIDQEIGTYCHESGEAYFLANEIMNLRVPGPIVECGCYKGAMTAKLSLVAAYTRRPLVVFDSFEGLPKSDEVHRLYPSYIEKREAARPFAQFSYHPSQYKGRLDEVVNNVAAYGDIAPCTFIKGWFEETLPNVYLKPAFVFMDVDLVTSAKTCLLHLWPQLVGPKFYTHEAFNATHMKALLDPKWWYSTLNVGVPYCKGDETGVNDYALGIAAFHKNNLPMF